MYLRHVLPEIERGSYSALSITQLPHGLKNYYQDHWRRMGMEARPLPQAKINIIYALGLIKRPWSRQEIAGAIGTNELTVAEVLRDWAPFLHSSTVNGERRYAFYHASFRDFLFHEETIELANVDLSRIQAQLGGYLFENSPFASLESEA
jgi:hypothetical protein